MKRIFLSFVLLFLMNAVFSQTFMHGAGITVLGSSTGGNFSAGEGFTYSPRFNFIETENMSVSVGIPLSLGISFSTNTYSSTYYGNEDPTSVGLVLNMPLIVNLNMGRGSTKDNRQKFGYFVGAGFGYHHGDFIEEDYSGDTYGKSTNTFGPAANAGLRFGVGRQHKNIEVRFSYMKGLNDEKLNIFGIGCLFNF